MSTLSIEAVEQAVLQVSVDVTPDGQITCSPDPLVVSGATDVHICFTLNAADWVFPATGAIVVAGSSSVQFPQPARSLGNRLVTLLDLNTQSGTYSYTVTVQHVVSGARSHIDPTIKNET